MRSKAVIVARVLLGLVLFVFGLNGLTGRFVPLALTVLAPIIVNIVAVHLFLAPSGFPLTILVVALELFSPGRTARRSARCCARVMTPRPPVEENAMIGTKPYEKLKYREVKGRQMAYIDEGEGDAIVFQHGQPASSCVWRNVMPHLEGRCRLIACDLIGMGRSEKLSASGPDRYRYSEHRVYLFALWDALDLGDRVLLVLDD
jgi:alpha/beta hydrolase fold